MRGAVLPAGNRLGRLWHAVEVSVVALEQSGIVPAGKLGLYGRVVNRAGIEPATRDCIQKCPVGSSSISLHLDLEGMLGKR